MRRVQCPPIGETSVLGFGCASFGSRVGAKEGARAVEAALEAGVTWFDVAPSYGGGEAERLLGEALGAAPVVIVTKVGLQATAPSAAKRLLQPLVRAAVAAAPALRPLVRSGRGAAAQRLPLSAESIRTSLARSLERLRRDHVGVFALHGPTLDDIRNEEVQRALADLRAQGLAKCIALAGSAEVSIAAREIGFPVDVVQVASNPIEKPPPSLQTGVFLVTHSVFGVEGAMQRLTAMMREPAFQARLSELGYDDPAALLIDYAFAANANGVVLASSFSRRHLAANAAAAGKAPRVELVEAVDALVAAMRAAT